MKETVAKSYCLTSVGRVRQSNEDSVAIIERPHFTLLAVCDGMGGHRKGEKFLTCLNQIQHMKAWVLLQ